MYYLTEASSAELEIVYHLQNTSEREKLLNIPLLPFSEFINRASKQISAGHEKYYLLFSDDRPNGFIWISVLGETCEIWGKHLRTLFYWCAKIAFEQLKMKRLGWTVRQTNRRMLNVCSLFTIRKTKEEFICNIAPRFEFIAVGKINYYEFTAEEYSQRIAIMRKYSLPISNTPGATADNS